MGVDAKFPTKKNQVDQHQNIEKVFQSVTRKIEVVTVPFMQHFNLHAFIKGVALKRRDDPGRMIFEPQSFEADLILTCNVALAKVNREAKPL